MANVIVTGSGGLIGSEAARHFIESGFDVIGLENNMRRRLFGPSASTAQTTLKLIHDHPAQFHYVNVDIRDREGIERCVSAAGAGVAAIIHAAAQPSHDWAASDPHADFGVNALGTLNLLDAARRHVPDAPFIFMSTNKVYGDLPNVLPLIEEELRLELPAGHGWRNGIDTTMSIDRSLHSLFGVSKASADLMVQEYGRYFGMPTVCFRAGCLTGPSHRGAKLHGFLSYLMRCCVSGEPYTVFGYGGKQVRDNLHSRDVVRAVEHFLAAPRAAAVYNLGGGRASNCSMLEAIALCEEIAGRPLKYSVADEARPGDHRWWISDVSEFQRDYPGWDVTAGTRAILEEIHAVNADEWASSALAAS